ncbi:MAG TPA: hypothetical protein VH682_23540 [Gemmataceae bacterium]|jgi:hypothetical protein
MSTLPATCPVCNPFQNPTPDHIRQARLCRLTRLRKAACDRLQDALGLLRQVEDDGPVSQRFAERACDLSLEEPILAVLKEVQELQMFDRPAPEDEETILLASEPPTCPEECV